MCKVVLCGLFSPEILKYASSNTKFATVELYYDFLHILPNFTTWWRFGAVGSDVGQINEVTLRRVWLVLGWVTVSGGFNSRCGKFISV